MPRCTFLHRTLLLLLAALLLGGCRGAETAEAMPAAQATAASTPAPTAAPTPTPSPVPTAVALTLPPAPEAEPTAEPSPTPEAEPAAEPSPAPEIEPAAESSPAPEAEPTAEPSPAPEAEPTAEPSPAGLCGDRFPDKFTETEVVTETSYQSPRLSIFLSKVYDEETFSSFVTYFVADVYVQDITLLRTAPAGADFTSLKAGSVKQMAKSNGALFAASGDYYAHNLQSGRTPLLIRNGVLYRDRVKTPYESCVLFRDGTMACYAPDELDPQALLDAGAWQGWTFGPSLLTEDGQPRKDIPRTYVGVDKRNPRCMLGYYEPGHYCVVVADGRQRAGRYSMGLTMTELAQLACDLGCTKAYNLDGGQSAQIYWQGKVYNHPTGGGRSISDILYFAMPDAPQAP